MPNQTQQNRKDMLGFVVLVLVISVVWGLSWVLVATLVPDWDTRSAFGDMFGAVNALFSGLALAGVIYAIILQRRELQLQRQELALTRAELKRSAEAQEKSEKALRDQASGLLQLARLNALGLVPAISCNISVVGSECFLTVSNRGNLTAYDVDIWALGIHHEDQKDVASFLSENLVPGEKHDWNLKATDEGFYGVFDRLWYPVVPHRRRVTARLAYPMLPSTVYMLVQFRDMQASSYFQVLWFFQSVRAGMATQYRLGDVEPGIPTLSARIRFDSIRNLATEDKTALPEEVEKHFLEFWRASIPSGHVDSDYPGPEDRGEWGEL